ncbi:HD domain-containing protein [Rhizobium lentis]|uniref:HD domain-containing protein n=1 Tax=Rhizobium lentis TaxID=1138194 RepID=A0A9Q3M9A6_9HYPH|nr:HD domain-containing protein [Rhizobium lentis]MBX4958736.1 HD domain-containing protein [Rhizobium lentis]MBX4988710.1 HD domain-containing protein [Rhizobium lentis]MBX5007159.1 HD domain-containing protein [Rhizobium lentis]MBX5012589.1 HD domain-containing protein [Rhizobium lentis]MBX5024188.1 HD domain-containing protein [Rhizobium lentis]
MQHLDHAMQIAIEAHKGQVDKTGQPFFEHCQRVALLVSGDEARTVAYLHDVAEKGSGWTLDRLREEGFPPAIISAVDALTRRPDEPDEEFVRRAAANPLALPVKQADLEDNLRQAEQAGKNTEKYQRGLDILRKGMERTVGRSSRHR